MADAGRPRPAWRGPAIPPGAWRAGGALVVVATMTASCDGASTTPGPAAGGGGGGAGGHGGGDDTPGVTWAGDVADIVQRHCVRCHAAGRLGSVAPLQTYAQAYELASLIGVKVQPLEDWGTQMPPFPGGTLPGQCEPEHAYANDLRLPPEDLQTILAWVAAGAPEGPAPHPAEPLTVPPVAHLDGATAYPLEEGYVVRIDADEPSGHRDEHVCVIVDPGVASGERLLDGIQVIAGEPQLFWGAVVRLDVRRESLAHVDSTSTRAHGEQWYRCDDGFGFDGDVVGGFLPEGGAITTPEGSALPIPGDALFVMRVHEHAHAEGGDDGMPVPPFREWRVHPSLLLRWANPGDVDRRASLVTFGDESGPVVDGTGSLTPPFDVPPLADGHVESMVTVVPGRADEVYQVWSVQPEMGPAGTQVGVSLVGPSVGPVCLGAHPTWDVRWQVPLIVDAASGTAPIAHGGDTLRIDCTYDTPDPTPSSVAESCRATVGLVRLD